MVTGLSDPGVRLSVRSYTLNRQAHAHSYHQLVFPLHGALDITLKGRRAEVGPGQCVVIGAGVEHGFSAHQRSSFLVADLAELPDNLSRLPSCFVSLTPPVIAFCHFAEIQLKSRLNGVVERHMGLLLNELLAQQAFTVSDLRIARVLARLQEDLTQTPSLEELAALACLSLSQYKTLFKRHTGRSTGQYLLELRMQRARALLANSDYPMTIVAQQVGYRDAAAFTRRFTRFFGQSPSHYRGRR